MGLTKEGQKEKTKAYTLKTQQYETQAQKKRPEETNLKFKQRC